MGSAAGAAGGAATKQITDKAIKTGTSVIAGAGEDVGKGMIDKIAKDNPTIDKESIKEVTGSGKKENLQVNGAGANNTPADTSKWGGGAFGANHWLSQASADDPTAIGAGTLFGGKKGGGYGGLLGGALRTVGGSLTGGDTTLYTDSGLGRETEVEEGQEITPDKDVATEEAAPDKVTESQGQQDYSTTFNAARDAQAKTFKWTNEEGVEGEYTTQLEGEDEEDWNNFLANTSNPQSGSGVIGYEGTGPEGTSSEIPVTYAHDQINTSIDDAAADEITSTNAGAAFNDERSGVVHEGLDQLNSGLQDLYNIVEGGELNPQDIGNLITSMGSKIEKMHNYMEEAAPDNTAVVNK